MDGGSGFVLLAPSVGVFEWPLRLTDDPKRCPLCPCDLRCVISQARFLSLGLALGTWLLIA